MRIDRKLKIALGDLRHNTIGRHSFYMPLGIAYIASYARSRFSDNIEIKIYDDPDVMIGNIKTWKPDVVGLSHYCWNSRLSGVVFSHARRVNPGTVCVAGGPEFPTDREECRKYLLNNPEIDFYIYFDGEVAFSNLVSKILNGETFSRIKSLPQDSTMCLCGKRNRLVAGELTPRLKNLDEIPSPYLNGLMDSWFNGQYAPAVQTTRGCPFTCGYCRGGWSFNSSVTRFSLKRIKDELTYIAKRVRSRPDTLLLICDSNFGMTERDEETAEFIKSLREEYGWPNNFNLTTGKANYDRILRITSLLNNRINVSTSLQSLNPETLEIVKRRNPPLKQYHKIQAEMKKNGIPSIGELIVPLPKETKETFFNGLKTLFNEGVDDVITYTTMILKGTYLDSKACRKKYKMKTKFRLLPRQFGEYGGKKCFEIEEVCVATDSMSFEDYLDCRGFALISSVLSHEQFDIIRKHLKELKIDHYKYLYYIFSCISSGKTELSPIYRNYIKETKEELWESDIKLRAHLSGSRAYDKIKNGELGDNLIRKYKTIIFIEHFFPLVDMLYNGIKAIASGRNGEEIDKPLSAAKSWLLSIRNIKNVFRDELLSLNEDLKLDYDINSWYKDGFNSRPLLSYKTFSCYKIFYDKKRLKTILDEGRALFGDEVSFMAGKLLTNWSNKNFWRTCQPLNEGNHGMAKNKTF